jgi:hypothetical protein
VLRAAPPVRAERHAYFRRSFSEDVLPRWSLPDGRDPSGGDAAGAEHDVVDVFCLGR